MTILLLEPIDPEARARLEREAPTLLVEAPEAALEAATEEPVAAILTRGKGRVSAALMEAAPALQVIGRVGVGLDNIDVEAASARGIAVVNNPGSTTIAVAEQTLLLLLALVRQLAPMTRAVSDGRWGDRRDYRGEDVAGKRLGIVGMGSIGEQTARLAAAFGMEVAYWSRSRKDVPWPRLAFDDLLARSDVVSLHVALTPDTRGLMGQRALDRLPAGAYLINTARGAIVDEEAVRRALDEGRLQGYAADVLADEPPGADHPLVAHPRVLLTPHTAALTQSTFRQMSHRTVSNVLAVLGGDACEPDCLVNADALSAHRPISD